MPLWIILLAIGAFFLGLGKLIDFHYSREGRSINTSALKKNTKDNLGGSVYFQ
ncbi:hypothetical protein [Bacillus infantis]|uniref:hypothetical protein n=1 Tax=Bacillus infantis TaxID=324767 RepID=UPI0016537040|nr:hypothetical protein [Bacillus infantis]